MDSLVTDTIIVTSNKVNITDSSTLPLFNEWFLKHILLRFRVEESNPIKLIILRNFKRCLIVCPDHIISEAVMSTMKETPPCEDLIFNYSLTDSLGNATLEKDYLKVPEHEKLYLISPPCSPPPEFDYSKCEDRPSMKTHAHEILRPLHKATSFVAVESSVGKITVDTCDDIDNSGPTLEGVRTALPPKSIFDDIED
ncbi:Calcipressin-like protein [Nakaseomyces bracarensis]|uniref:Calcipressin-like protein n=1 Tax=Nakaseomyces bracarensis TaxID=273131 RepID=A0ABR4NS75_9SACH